MTNGCRCLRGALVKHQLCLSCRVQQRLLSLPCREGCLSCPQMMLTGHVSNLEVLPTSVQGAVVPLGLFLSSLPSTRSAAIPPPSPGTCFWYCTWFIDGVGRLHASVDVISYVAVQKPRSRVFCYKFNCLESSRKKVIHVSSVVFICLWQGKTSIVRVLP